MWTIWTPWGVFQVHFCADEIYMLMMFLGMSSGLVAWVRSKFKKEHLKHHDCCHPNDSHEEGKK